MREILLIILIVLMFAKISSSQEMLEIPKDYILIDSKINTLDNYPHVFSIDTLNHYFNGSLVIEINHKVELFDRTHYPTKVFWIESLSDIHNVSKHYVYLTDIAYWMEKFSYSNNPRNYEKYFSDFYVEFNRESKEKNYNTYLYSYEDQLNTNMFDTLTVWEYNDNHYIIVSCSFVAAIVNVKYFDNTAEKTINYRTFIPISQLKKFKEENDEILLKFGMKKSKAKVNLY